MDRALGFEPRGRGFESLWAHPKTLKKALKKTLKKTLKRAGRFL